MFYCGTPIFLAIPVPTRINYPQAGKGETFKASAFFEHGDPSLDQTGPLAIEAGEVG